MPPAGLCLRGVCRCSCAAATATLSGHKPCLHSGRGVAGLAWLRKSLLLVSASYGGTLHFCCQAGMLLPGGDGGVVALWRIPPRLKLIDAAAATQQRC